MNDLEKMLTDMQTSQTANLCSACQNALRYSVSADSNAKNYFCTILRVVTTIETSPGQYDEQAPPICDCSGFMPPADQAELSPPPEAAPIPEPAPGEEGMGMPEFEMETAS